MDAFDSGPGLLHSRLFLVIAGPQLGAKLLLSADMMAHLGGMAAAFEGAGLHHVAGREERRPSEAEERPPNLASALVIFPPLIMAFPPLPKRQI